MGDKTKFAPAERASSEALGRQARTALDAALLRELFDAVNEEILVLNRERQIVFCNRGFSDALGVKDRALLLGLRPGEALRCVHAFEEHAGCGTSKFCEACGAVNAILQSQKGETAVRECRIQQESHGESLDLKIKASPLNLDGETLTAVAIQDISHEKRRRALEQIFFHDVLNTVQNIGLNTDLMEMSPPEEIGRLRASVTRGLNRLIKEIQGQRALMSAEAGELLLNVGPLDALTLLRETAEAYERHEAAHGRLVRIDPRSKPLPFQSDRAIVLRVLENLTKNALEAVSPGETVTLGCAGADGGIKCWVHNPGVIPKDVRLRIFQRSFSTKGPGRGLGTYSVKLLTEKYLGGKADFFTSEADGTNFSIWFPAEIPGSTTGGKAGAGSILARTRFSSPNH
jgi:signal transduction histidine kinase